MTTAGIKEKLIGKIRKIENKDLLEEIMRLLEIETEDTIYETTADQKKAIQEARGQYEKGDFKTKKDADNEIDQWLEE
jgi:hypothetical protein